MIKLKKILEGITPPKIDKAKEAKILYVKAKNGNYIITPKTLRKHFDAHPHKGVNPKIADNFIKKFDYYAFNQFASKNPLSNVENDYNTIRADYLAMYQRW